MQPRQLWLVFCSENNNAKQALPDQKDSRKLEMSVLVYGKRRVLWSHIKKWAENEQGIFTLTQLGFFFPFICWPELPSDLDFFGFVLLKLEAVMWLRDTVLEKETQLKTVMQVQAPKHIPCMLSPTDLSGTSAQELKHI